MKHRFTVLLSGVLALILALGGLPGLVLPARAETTVPVVKSITDTGVEAEAVMAAGEGYASLMVSAHYDADGSLASLPQAALMERSGFLVMPYTETWHYYFVDDGVISLASNLYRSYSGGQPASFYTLSEQPSLFARYGFASAMIGGAALVLEVQEESETMTLCLIDRTGGKAYTFPEGFGTVNGAGGDEYFTGVGCERTAGWPGEGLIALGHGEAMSDGSYVHWTDSYADLTGAPVLTLPKNTYHDAYPFSEGYARVQKPTAAGERFGFLDREGREVIPCVYTAAGDFSDGLAGVAKDGGAGYIDTKGSVVIPFLYDDVYGAGEGVCTVVKDGKCGLVDYTGAVVLPLEYDDITPCAGGVAYAIRDGRVQIVEIGRETVEEPAYWAVREVSEAIAAGLVPVELRRGYDQEISRAAVSRLFLNLIEQCAGMPVEKFLADRGLTIDPDAFQDTSDPAVLAMNALGIIHGTGQGRFSPEGSLTRSQAAAIICRIARVLGQETEGFGHEFTDVAGHWVDPELGWPVHAEVIKGVGGGKFDPDGALTLQQAILIAERTRKYLTAAE